MAAAAVAEEATAGQAVSQPSSPAKAVEGEAEWRAAWPTLPLEGPFLCRDRSDQAARKERKEADKRTEGSQEALGTGGPPSNLGALPHVRTPDRARCCVQMSPGSADSRCFFSVIF